MSSKQTTQSSSSTTPWGPQAGALTTAFTDAGNALSQTQGIQTPTNFVSSFDPSQISNFNQMLGYANGSAQGIPQAAQQNGGALLGYGLQGTQGALSGYGSFNPTTANNPQSLINSANAYAAGQNIPALTAAAMQPAMETARDVTMPGLEANAAGTGNTNGSRTSIAEGLVQRGLAENAQNTAAQLQSNAYNNGLNLAENAATTNNNQTLAALQGQGALGLNATNSGTQTQSQGIQDAGQLYQMADYAGSGLTAANQANINNNLASWQAQQQAPWTPLQNYMSIIGTNNWGGTTNTQGTSTTSPSIASIVGGLASGIGSFMSPTYGIGSFSSMSDRRMKTDIRKVGKLDDGQQVYAFRYKHDPSKQVHIGLMAQDVEKNIPEAVHEFNGIKFVDYGRATAHLA
jgi:hypothetical protein